jgi:hypothetical protein
MKTLNVISAQYIEDYKVRIMFSDHTWQAIDFRPFLFAYDRGYYNKYRKPSVFKRFKIEEGNIVWGENQDLIFPVEMLHSGKLKFNKTPLTKEEFKAYINKQHRAVHWIKYWISNKLTTC